VKDPIEQRIGYKDASVRVILEGQVEPGYRIADVSVEPSIVTVVGSPGALDDIGGYLETAAVNVNEARSDVVERVTLQMPENVSLLGAQSVLVDVSVMPLEGGLNLQGLPLTWQGLAPDWEVKASPEAVDVILSGPLPRLDPLTQDEVQVIVDVYGLEPGTHKIAPTVIVPEGITVKTLLPDIVEVEITSKRAETPVSPLTPGATSEPTTPSRMLQQNVTPGATGSP
jgi:YbbR domain-containing protein